MTDTLTNSSMNMYDECPEKYHLRYEQSVETEKEPAHFRIGTAYHEGMRVLGMDESVKDACQAIAVLYSEQPDSEEMRVELETVMRMVCGWAWRWSEDGIVVVEAEKVFRDHPIINPETNGKAQTHTLSGKTDQIIQLPDKRRALREFKTTSDDISPGSDYWPHLNMNRQVNLYYMVQKQDPDNPVTAILYDVVRKPGIRPKKPVKKDVADWPMYYSEKIDLKEPPELETPAMYGARLTADITERPDFYFGRREIAILESHTRETMQDTWQIHVAIQDSKRRNHWRRATRSCFNYGRCPFFEICSAGTDVTVALPEGFIHKAPHSELEN